MTMAILFTFYIVANDDGHNNDDFVVCIISTFLTILTSLTHCGTTAVATLALGLH